MHEVLPVKPLVAILVVSDTRFREVLQGGAASDVSGRIAYEVVSSVWDAYRPIIVPNQRDVIRGMLYYILDRTEANVVILIGGTGVAPRDVTVDVAKEVADRELPGFGEEFRRISYMRVGPPALLSRASAFIIRNKIVYVVPGSPNAVETAIRELIIKVTEHALSELQRT